MSRSVVTLTAILAVAVAVAVPALGQRREDGPPPARPPVWVPPKDANYDLFRGLLHFYGVEPVTPGDLDDLPDRDFRSVIVVVLNCSDRRGTRGVEEYARKAVRNGGALLIATDQNADLSEYFDDKSDVAVSGNATKPRRAADCYDENPDFPFVLPHRPQQFEPALAALWDDRPRVATNRPGTLFPTRWGRHLQQAIGKLPLDTKGNAHYFAVGGVGLRNNPFRALVMADPDVLSNQMLYSSGTPDRTGRTTDNWSFAIALAREFLREPHVRTKCLFVENGEVVTRFDKVELKSIQNMTPTPQLPLPNPLDRNVQQKMAEWIDGQLAQVEDDKLIDRPFQGYYGGRNSQWTMAGLAVAAAGLLTLLMVRRLFGSQHAKSFVPAPADPLFLGDDTAVGSFGQRRAELLRGSDFRDPLVHHLRTLFADRGLPAEYAGRRPPRVEVRGRGPQSEQLRRDVIDLWHEAFPNAGRTLGYREWKDLEPVLADVHAAAVADRWRFAPTSPEGSA